MALGPIGIALPSLRRCRLALAGHVEVARGPVPRVGPRTDMNRRAITTFCAISTACFFCLSAFSTASSMCRDWAGNRAGRDPCATWRFRSRQCGVLGRSHECARAFRAPRAARTPRWEPSSWPCSHNDWDLRRCRWRCKLPLGSDETARLDLSVFWCAVDRATCDVEARILQDVKCAAGQGAAAANWKGRRTAPCS